MFSSTASIFFSTSSKSASTLTSPIPSLIFELRLFNSSTKESLISFKELYSSLMWLSSFLESSIIELTSSFAFSIIFLPVSSAVLSVSIREFSTLLNLSLSCFNSSIFLFKSDTFDSSISNSLEISLR